jgi:hypothetical protein
MVLTGALPEEWLLAYMSHVHGVTMQPKMLSPYMHVEVEAAVAYDIESVQRRGLEAITNFALDEYTDLLSERSLTYRRTRALAD